MMSVFFSSWCKFALQELHNQSNNGIRIDIMMDYVTLLRFFILTKNE